MAVVAPSPLSPTVDAVRSRHTPPEPRTAVIIPCFNEEATITRVVAGFRAALPTATIYVYDNNSKDRTAMAARAAGAILCQEALQGKGHVVRRAFADIDAEIYVLVDGDDTYDPEAAPQMVRRLIEDRLDMVTAVRISEAAAAYRPGHRFGNRVLTALVQIVFGNRISDILSGYRVFSRRFVKSFPALATGFETETEFTVHALELCMPVRDVLTLYRQRPAGSVSKLRTLYDGFRIVRTILLLVKEERPLPFFLAWGLLTLMIGIILATPVIIEFSHTGLVPRLPTAVLSMGLTLLSFLAFSCGLILDSVARGRKEIKRLAYLAASPVGAESARR